MCSQTIPGYWMNEASGALWPAVRAYLEGCPMTEGEIAAMRAYIRQWIAAEWVGEAEVAALRRRVDGLTTREAITSWLDDALAIGIDPL